MDQEKLYDRIEKAIREELLSQFTRDEIKFDDLESCGCDEDNHVCESVYFYVAVEVRVEDNELVAEVIGEDCCLPDYFQGVSSRVNGPDWPRYLGQIPVEAESVFTREELVSALIGDMLDQGIEFPHRGDTSLFGVFVPERP